MSLLQTKFRKEISPSLMKQLGYTNIMQVPKLDKIVINTCLSEAVKNPKILNTAADELTEVTGQKTVITKAKKAISNFKIREGIPLGAMVTLRREKMWTFVERLVNITIPRVRDFRGLPPRGFDGRGNYNMGLKEQIVFPEINYDKVEKIHGLNITICTTAKSDAEGKALLEALGMPFRK